MPWTILIVDDDAKSHDAAALALANLTCLGRQLQLIHAHSTAQARDALRRNSDIAIILLNAGMEAGGAGEELLRYIREILNLHTPRIILRTARPGDAPNRDLVLRYDINDHKAMSELSEAGLFTTVLAALRGYRHLTSLETSRLALRKVIDAASSLRQTRSLERFADGVLTELSTILDCDAHGVLCKQRRTGTPGELIMLAGSGRFRELWGGSAELPRDADFRELAGAALARPSHIFRGGTAALYLKTPTKREVVLYIESGRAFTELDLSLLEMFGQGIGVGYDNLEIYRQLQVTSANLEQRVIERTQALTESETHLKQFKSAVEHSSASIFIADAEGLIIYANPAVLRTSGYPAQEILGRHADLFKSAATPQSTYNEMWDRLRRGESWRGELLNRRRDEALHWEDVSISPVTDAAGAITNFVVVKDEISERKMMEEELRHLATIDPLTGLLNRRSFFALAEEDVIRRRRSASPLSVAMLDVDHFKSINDSHGHRAGDEVLRALAVACSACMRERDFIGRLGGEEFACILPDTSQNQAMLAAEKLRAEVASKKIYLEDGAEISITISIGIATFQPADTSIDTVLHRADQALYTAKQSGRNCVRGEGLE